MSSAPLTGHMDALLKHIKSVRNELTKLHKPKAEDLVPFQQHLRTIEEHKHNGVWCGNLSSGLIPHGQAHVQDAFQEAHDLIEKMQEEAEKDVPAATPSAEAAAPAAAAAPSGDDAVSLLAAVTMQVQEVLSELKRMQFEGNVNTAAILPFQRHLRAIQQYKAADGVWCGNLMQKGAVPACQVELNQIFEEADKLAAKLAADDDDK